MKLSRRRRGCGEDIWFFFLIVSHHLTLFLIGNKLIFSKSSLIYLLQYLVSDLPVLI